MQINNYSTIHGYILLNEWEDFNSYLKYFFLLFLFYDEVQGVCLYTYNSLQNDIYKKRQKKIYAFVWVVIKFIIRLSSGSKAIIWKKFVTWNSFKINNICFFIALTCFEEKKKNVRFIIWFKCQKNLRKKIKNTDL